MKTKTHGCKTFALRCTAAKHRALKSMLAEMDMSLQRFVDEVTTVALAQHEARKRFMALRREAQSPEKAVALLHSVQKRAGRVNGKGD